MMADVPTKSCRIYIRYGSGAADSLPTADDIKEIFSVHGNIVDVDRRTKFCFVEYDNESSAEKAVSTENGRNFKGINLQVEIAMGSRKVRNTSNDTSNAETAGTVKKSSFSTDRWLAQREAAMLPEQDEVTVPQSHRSRSRSPLTNAKSSMQTHSRISHEQRSQYSQMDQLRRLEAQLDVQSKRHSASVTSSSESTRGSARQSTYLTDAKSSMYQHNSYDRELPQSVTGSSRPLKPALRQPSTSSVPMDAYSTKDRTEDLVSKMQQYRQLARSVDHTLSQMKNSSKHVSAKYDDMRDPRVESNVDNSRRDSHKEVNSAHQTTSAAGARCEIFINNISLSDYAKQVGVRIERIGLLVHISVISASADIMDEVSEAMSHGCLYALSITGPQSTLYILHGEPEEHRNMLIEDALQMIGKNFADYYRHRQTRQSYDESSSSSLPVSSMQMPTVQPASVTTPQLVTERLQPDTVTRRLIGLLSADCELTHNELEHIISYLRLRQKALVSAPAPALPVSSSHEAGLGKTDLDLVNCLLIEAAKFASRR